MTRQKEHGYKNHQHLEDVLPLTSGMVHITWPFFIKKGPMPVNRKKYSLFNVAKPTGHRTVGVVVVGGTILRS